MKKQEPLTVYGAPAAGRPTTEQHRRDELLLHQTREWIVGGLEAFADELERLAKTPKQGVQADRFQAAVQDLAAGGPLTAADFSGHTNFPGWLQCHAARFQELATTAPQQSLATSFRDFARQMSSPEMQDIFQRPLVNELVEDLQAWMQGSSNGVPFASLSREGKRELLGVGIDWTDYLNRGLAVETKETSRGIAAIIDNAIAGKPSDQWLDGAPGRHSKTGTTGSLANQLFRESPPPPPPEQAKERQRKR
jgi:hypothetical protein